MLPMGFGDEWLRFNGIGENVTWGMYNNDTPTEAQKDALVEVLRWAVSRGMTATFHWHNDRAVHHLLDVLERVNAETPVARLRWSIAHLNDASRGKPQAHQGDGARLADAERVLFPRRGVPRPARRRALRASRRRSSARCSMGIPVGGGTDAHRVMSYSPFVSLQWMLDGKTAGGVAMRAPEELPTRLEALRLYTQGSAWFSFEDDERGALAAGKLADLAVLSKDYLTVPVDEIGGDRLAAHHGRRSHRLRRRAVRGL